MYVFEKMSRFGIMAIQKDSTKDKKDSPVEGFDSMGRLPVDLKDLKPHIAQMSVDIDRPMTYIICGIVSQYLKIHKPGFKETKNYRID